MVALLLFLQLNAGPAATVLPATAGLQVSGPVPRQGAPAGDRAPVRLHLVNGADRPALPAPGRSEGVAGAVPLPDLRQEVSQAERRSEEFVAGEGRPTVTIPRIEAEIEVDGRLDEPVWSQAVRLGGFWQQQPVDGRRAEEETQVLVWYSPEAIHFGILAFDSQPGTIRATVADRDNLDRDDTVTIYLDTFNDRRRAFFFTVNPLGVQQDGVQTEGAGSAGHWAGYGQGDRNPDYHFDSKGRITEAGYVVEVRIPFKSLRFQGTGEQSWGLNVQRTVQRTGYQDTWTDVRRASSSFLGQAGVIDGLFDMKRGIVTEIQPFLAAAVNGTRQAPSGFAREKPDYTPGANLRLGFTNSSLDATINPDFSQVESDAGQVTANERFALYYPEKRPFFLEGNELFSTPNQLVYTRTIVQPIAGGKYTGKVGKTSFAYLLARDQVEGGQDATVNIARVRRDVGLNSLAGVTFTDRTSAAGFNRVLAADTRITFAKMYYVQGQLGGSWTQGADGLTRGSPIWNALLDCTGRSWGCRYELKGIGTDFETQSGFVNRSDIVNFSAMNRFTWYGDRGAAVEDFSINLHASRLWEYAGFGKDGAIEGSERLRVSAEMRGGWEIQGSIGREFVHFDPAMYAGYEVVYEDGLVLPYDPPDLFSGFGPSLEVQSPVFRHFNASFDISGGAVAIFPEASTGRERRISTSLNLRPTESIRAEALFTYSRIVRERDGSEFARTLIPRVKIEYQPVRSLFVRLVGEYRAEREAELRDARTGNPLRRGPNPFFAERSNGLRIDALFSYEPTPGTVAFFGYGSSMDTHRNFSLRGLRRTNDGFFLKLAYQIRM